MRADSYSIVVRYMDEENGYEAKVLELPDVAEYGDTYSEAYDLALDTISTTSEIMAEKGRNMPAPVIQQNDYSGRITLRLPKTLHASLAHTAEREETSLNQMIAVILASFRGFDCAMEDTMDGWVVMKETALRVRPREKTMSTVKVLKKTGNATALPTDCWHDTPGLRTA